MSNLKLGQLWGIVCIASVIIMLIVQNTTGWGMAWIIPMIGVLICCIVSFLFSNHE